MLITDNAKKELDSIVSYINGNTVAEFMSKKLFLKNVDVDIPFKKWSTLNQLNIFRHGSDVDYRGFRQWNDVGRRVVKGAKASFILFPMFKKVDDKKTGEEKEVLTGFRCSPVFSIHDTEGDPVEYQDELKGFLDIEGLPLIGVAKHLGVKVEHGLTERCNGYFMPSKKNIVLGTDDVSTWYHELAHAVDEEIPGKSDDYAYNEVVAEMTSCLIIKTMHGDIPEAEKRLPHTKAYVTGYAGKKHGAQVVVKAMDRVLEIFTYIQNYK
jgi:antirestriction protein ArdC